MTRKSRMLTPTLAAAGAVLLFAATTQAAAPSTTGASWERNGLFRYTAPNGSTYFAISMRAPGNSPRAAVSRDHVILVDTSASQAGAHRRQAFAVVKELLKRLPQGDRVRLFAVDLNAQPLTKGFVVPTGDEAKQALAALNRRFPAGATDMTGALNAALKSFGTKRAGSILYIGDGMSTAKFLQSKRMKTLFVDLRRKQIPVNSYAVGPNKDLPVLGMLAQQTGGRVFVDRGHQTKDAPVPTARKLVSAVTSPVLFPTSLKSSKNLSVLPASAMPLRWDRDTIVLGRVQGQGALQITVKNGKSVVFAKTFSTNTKNSGHTYLAGLWRRAVQTKGLSVPLAGRSMLNAAHDEFNDRVSGLVARGELAIATRRLKDAAKIGRFIQRLDPDNVQAKALISASKKRLKLRTVAFLQPKTADPLKKAAKLSKEDDGLKNQQRLRQIRLQNLQRIVAATIRRARGVSPTNPDGAISLLKELLETVKGTQQIDPGPKADLQRRIQTTILEVNSQKERNLNRQIRRMERIAQKEAQQRLVDKLQEEHEQLRSLIDSVRALIVDGIHGDDDAYEEAEEVSRHAVDLQPGNGTATAALFGSEAAGQLNKAFRLRSLRADRWLETLYQVELSHVPFPDEPPIRWPAAEVWQALTERRKKWASVDLHKNSPAEEKIQSELKRTTQVDFVETSLKDAIEFIADQHNITIIINEEALMDEGIMTDTTQITRSLSGIKLRSVLKIILEPLNLTYIIENEVMVITTQAKADEKLTTRVYPVADLVIPINSQGMGGGGVLGGGMGGGGMGGGMGGGGMGGGMGGMGGGMGGMGGGGGMFSVPPAKMRIIRSKRPRTEKKMPVGDDEAQNLLDNILGDASHAHPGFVTQNVAFLDEKTPAKPFRLDNDSVNTLKKKAAL